MSKTKKRSRFWQGARYALFVLMTIVLIGMTTAAICGMAFAVYINKYVSTDVDIYLDSYRLNLTSFIYAVDPATGEEVQLESLHGIEDRVWVELDKIPKQLKDAFIAVEDHTFYEHHGVNWRRTIGAGLNYVLHFRDNFGGGSTITQQLIKNLTGEDETSVKRKIQEAMRALELEKKYEKDDILELYLNKIYFGQSAYGVQQAALTYFDKELDQLSLAECAALAGIVKNPYGFDLFRFPEKNAERRAVVLGEMKEYGKITQEEYDKAMAEDVQAVRRDGSETEEGEVEYQSYFVDALIEAVIADLQNQKGYSYNTAKELLYSGGLKVVATIDTALQDKMEAVFTDTENFPGGLGADGTYPQASMVLMDPYTGHVLALWGGRGEKEGDRVLNRATQTYRSPGSSIKPITVYSPAIEYDLVTPISVVEDGPKDFASRASGWPYNENRRWSGQTTIFNGIAQSYNTVAVDLMQKIGVQRAFNWGTKNLGLNNLVDTMTRTDKDGNVHTYSDIDVSPLALGSLTKGVTVLEMTAAYCSFVNDGQYTTPVLYTAVYDSNGNLILDNEPVTTVAMEERTREYMLQLLTGAVKNGTGRRAAIDGFDVGGKTGTTSSDNDRWFCGITPYYVGAVWFGYDQQQSLQKFSTNPALYLWHEVMTRALEGKEPRTFDRAEGLVAVNYCVDSGLLAGEWCSQDTRGSRVATAYLYPEDVPTRTCSVHVGCDLCGTTGLLATPYCPLAEVKTVGAMSLHRTYPSPNIAITDQIYCLPYELTAEETAQGLYKPGTSTMLYCTEHSAENDGNAVPEIPDPMDPLVPVDPLDPFNPFEPVDPPVIPPDPFAPTEPTEPTEPDVPVEPDEPPLPLDP